MRIGSALKTILAGRGTVAWVAGCAVLGIYLFATRPAALPEH